MDGKGIIDALRRRRPVRADPGEIAGGLALALVGAGFWYIGQNYPMGTPRMLGSGAVPVTLGAVSVIMGLVLAAMGFFSRERTLAGPLLPVALVVAGMLLWAWLLPRFGLVPATVTLVLVSSLASWPPRPKTALAVAAVMATVGVLFFVRTMGMPMRPLIW